MPTALALYCHQNHWTLNNTLNKKGRNEVQKTAGEQGLAHLTRKR